MRAQQSVMAAPFPGAAFVALVLLTSLCEPVFMWNASELMAQQTTLWIDAGGGTVRQPLAPERRAATLGVGGLYRQSSWWLAGESAVTFAEDSMGAAQAVLRAAFTPQFAPWSSTELDVSATTNGIQWPGRNGNRSAMLRQQVVAGPLRAFVAGGAGLTNRFDFKTLGAALQLGATATSGPLSGSVTVQRAITDDYLLAEGSGFFLREFPTNYQLQDATLGVTWHTARLTVSAAHVWRAGYDNTRGTATGHSFSAAWRVAGPLELIAQGGRQLPDVIRAVPQVDYVALSARWIFGARRNASRATAIDNARANSRARSANAEASFEATSARTELVLRVNAPANATVEVASSVSDWTPQPMTRDGERFVLRLPLPSGSHRVAVRINGGEWRAPRGLISVTDDFGGTAGVVVVP